MSADSSTPAAADRNLLFGILALQMDFISRDALIAAMNAWVLNKAKPLGQILQEQAVLSGERRALLEALVQEHLKQHDNDPEKSLAAVSSIKSVRRDLESIADPDLHASLAMVAAGPARTPETTIDDVKQAGLRYRILRPHAKGGLGEVYVAEDQELHREVALKELQPTHADNPQSRGRFLLEAEITGGLEHPGIVPVYGLGQYDDGRPFYAMRFIKGDNLKEAIRRFHEADKPGRDPGERSLALRQLLRRFIDVCNAVAYAHSRGVLHRDLKPGNIMLAKYGETLIIDWGLAKPVGRDRAGSVSDGPDERTLRPTSGSGIAATQMGSAIGTPGYMSPEQALGNLDRLGPASDVYSLGATLYALLTGQAPFREREVADVLEKVRNGDFPWPRQIKPAVPPALEAVCLKAMALKSEDRYGTPLELAADIEHWLADEPVSAYREPWSVRSGRWLRRHRPLVAGTAALLLAAVPLSIVIAVNREQARRQAEADKLEISTQKNIAQANEKAARDQEAETKAVLHFVEDKVFAAARPKGRPGGLGPEVTLRQAIEAALPFVQKSFADQPLVEARLRQTLGTSFWCLGDAKTAAEQYEEARRLYARYRGSDDPVTLACMNNLANSFADLGRHAEALALRKETLSLQTAKLGPDHLDTLGSMVNLANSYLAFGRYTEALKLYEMALPIMKDKLSGHPFTINCMGGLANTYLALGENADALKLYEQTLALQKRKLGSDHPDTLGTMNNMAISFTALGRHADALMLREETLRQQKVKLGRSHPDTLMSMNNLAESYAALGRHGEALQLREKTLSLQRAKLGADHPDTLSSMNGLALNYANLGRYEDALKLHQETLALRKAKLGQDHPDTLWSMNNLAASYAFVGQHTEALKLFEATLALRKAKLSPDHPHTLLSMDNMAACFADLNRHNDALKLREETMARRKAKLGSDHPDTLKSMCGLAESLVKLDRGVEAVPLIDECVQRAAGKVIDPRLLPEVMDLRLRHFEKTKDAAGCRQTAEMWEKLNHTDAGSLYDTACMRAVTAAVIRVVAKTAGADATRLAKEETDRAMAWLKQAVAAGYKDAAHMKKDKDLDVLRDREDFKKLLAELEAAAKSGGK
jgi:serine/threonine protein kinase